jgi:hypothetical protein
MPTFDVTCTGALPHSAVSELGRRGVLRSSGGSGSSGPDGTRHVLRIEGATSAESAARIALQQVREAGGKCRRLEVAGVTS